MSNRALKITTISLLFIGLAMVRVFEKTLFYDPYLVFYTSNYSEATLENLSFGTLILNVFFRYLLNTILSISILYVAFRKKDILRFTILFYSISFLILITAYAFVSLSLTKETYQLFFYIRRFLIQPIFVLLLLPAFYYQRIHK